MTTLAPVVFDAVPVNPAPGGLVAATIWTTDQVPRWFGDGVEVRPFNYGGSSGVWAAQWDGAEEDLGEDDIKTGERPDLLDPFVRATIWGYDEGLVEAVSQEDVNERAAQNLRLNAPVALEAIFAARALSDSPYNPSLTDIVDAVGEIESWFGATGTLGFIHASPRLAALAAKNQLIVRGGTGLKTPMGNTWVFGGGYEEGLELKLVATSQPYGWRTEPEVRGNSDVINRKYGAVAEQSFVIGYEAVLGFVDLDD